jgi:hypothetical protein
MSIDNSPVLRVVLRALIDPDPALVELHRVERGDAVFAN